jgi:hypothetical protein
MTDTDTATQTVIDGLGAEHIDTHVNDHANDKTYIGNYPTTFRPAVNVEFAGTFVRLDRGQANDFGVPFIAVFDMAAGMDHEGNDVAGTRVGLFLIHNVARKQLFDLKPQIDELVAGIYLGKVDKKNPTPAMIKANNTTYHNYRFTCPARPVAAPPTWDDLGADATDEPGF